MSVLFGGRGTKCEFKLSDHPFLLLICSARGGIEAQCVELLFLLQLAFSDNKTV